MKTKLLAGALLAATLIPAAAQAQDRDHDRDRPGWSDHRDRDHRGDWRDGRRDDRRRGDWHGGDARGGDWRGWRDQHPDYYRRGGWEAPFRYRPFGVGMVVPRDYWAPRYAINNWDYYRLPRPAYGYYRYVRHYDDVLLINARTGRVVQVYRGFYR